jgi:Peptidase family M23
MPLYEHKSLTRLFALNGRLAAGKLLLALLLAAGAVIAPAAASAGTTSVDSAPRNVRRRWRLLRISNLAAGAAVIGAALLFSLARPPLSLAASGSGYLPFPAGTAVHVYQGNGPGNGCSTHCTQPDLYAWDFGSPSSNASEGMQITSATSGTVIGVRSTYQGQCTNFYSACAFGNYVFVHNDDGTYSEYLHMQAGSAEVTPGQPITVGTPIGKIGNTGFTRGFSHLHYSWLAIARGTGDSPSVGYSIPGGFVGIGNPTTGQNLTSNNPGAQHASVALIPNDGASGYRVDAFGVLYPFGNAPAVTSPSPVWHGWDIVRGIAIFPRSTWQAVQGYVLDGYGGIHPFAAGIAVAPPTPALSAYWSGWDIARGIALRGNTSSGYVLDGYGGIHPFGGAPTVATSAYWSGWDIARGIVLSSAVSGYVLDGYGGIHPFGGAPTVATSAYWSGWDIARGLTLSSPTSGYVLDGYGGIHPFGGAPPSPTPPGYSPPNDIFRGIAFDPSTNLVVDVTGGAAGTQYSWHP